MFDLPSGFIINSQETRMYVSDAGNNRIQRFELIWTLNDEYTKCSKDDLLLIFVANPDENPVKYGWETAVAVLLPRRERKKDSLEMNWK